MAPQIISLMVFKNRDAAFKNHEVAGHPIKEKGVVETQLPISRGGDAIIPKDLAAKLLAKFFFDAEGGQVFESFTVGGDIWFHSRILCN
jgi:hypothetical protein